MKLIEVRHLGMAGSGALVVGGISASMGGNPGASLIIAGVLFFLYFTYTP